MPARYPPGLVRPAQAEDGNVAFRNRCHGNTLHVSSGKCLGGFPDKMATGRHQVTAAREIPVQLLPILPQ
jgi:hypothetical protein